MTSSQPLFPWSLIYRWSFVIFALAKVASSGWLLINGDYRAEKVSGLRRFVTIISKITPSLACISLAGMEFMRGKRVEAAALIVFAVAVAFFAARVVQLRNQKRFFGLADQMLKVMSPRQVKMIWISVLCVVFLLILRFIRQY